MAETWLAKLKALEAHIATLQTTRAQTTAEAARWRKVREELDRIVPRSHGKPWARRQIETARAADAAWDELRAELDALRLRIVAELEARHSGKRLASNESYPSDEKSPQKGR